MRLRRTLVELLCWTGMSYTPLHCQSPTSLLVPSCYPDNRQQFRGSKMKLVCFFSSSCPLYRQGIEHFILDPLLGLDKLCFIFAYYSILVFPQFLPIILFILPIIILFILSIALTIIFCTSLLRKSKILSYQWCLPTYK